MKRVHVDVERFTRCYGHASVHRKLEQKTSTHLQSFKANRERNQPKTLIELSKL